MGAVREISSKLVQQFHGNQECAQNGSLYSLDWTTGLAFQAMWVTRTKAVLIMVSLLTHRWTVQMEGSSFL